MIALPLAACFAAVALVYPPAVPYAVAVVGLWLLFGGKRDEP